ncbi:MAG: alpha/beta hydrolase, partial [Coleofasciculaceae cyanobacterium]
MVQLPAALPIMPKVLNSLILLLSCLACFLSSWIVIPAPIYPLLILGVGAPEISPWLIILNFIPLGITATQAILASRVGRKQGIILVISTVGLILSLLPLLQLPTTQQKMSAAMF